MRRAAILLLAVLLGGGPVVAREAGERRIRFQTSEGTRMSPDVSPDGRRIVFDLLGTIYTVPIGGGTARPLTGPESLSYRPRFSPDGRSIAYLSEDDGTLNIWIMDADGRNARPITRQDPRARSKAQRFFMAPEWTPDGKAVAAAVASERTYYGADDIVAFPLNGNGKGESLLRLPPDTSPKPTRTAMRTPFPREGLEPAFSPDGRYLYYAMRTPLARQNGEFLLPRYQVERIDLASGSSSTIVRAPLGSFTPAISPDGRSLVYATRWQADAGLRVRDLASGEDRWLAFPIDRDANENFHSEGLSNAVSFMPDGKSVVTSFDGGLKRIDIATGAIRDIPFTAAVDKRLPRLARHRIDIPDGGMLRVRHIEHPSLSPDGRRVAFAALNRIWIKQLPDGAPVPVDSGAGGVAYHPAWSPDGRSLLFATFDENRREGTLRVADVDGGTSRPIASNGFYSFPSYAPDGAAIVFVRADITAETLTAGMSGGRIVERSIANGTETPLAEIDATDGFIRPEIVAGAPDRIFFHAPGTGLLSIPRAAGGMAMPVLHLRPQEIGVDGIDRTGRTVKEIRLRSDARSALLFTTSNGFGGVLSAELSRPAQQVSGAVISSIPGKDRLEAREISTIAGGVFPFWDNANHPAFMLADTLFRASPDAAPSAMAEIRVEMPRLEQKSVVALRGGRIITMSGDDGGVIANGDVLIRGERIAAIGPAGSLPIPDGAHIIDLAGASVMPGLIDSHSHQYDLEPPHAPPATSWALANKLAYGVTTILDPASPLELFRMADMVEAGSAIGPRIFQSAGILDPFISLTDEAAAIALVDRNARYYREPFIKSYDVGGRLNRLWVNRAADAAGVNVVVESEGSLNYTASLILEGHAHLAHGLAAPWYGDVNELLRQSGTGIAFQFGTLRGEGGPSSAFHFADAVLDWNDPKLMRFLPAGELYPRWWRRIAIQPEDNVFPYYARHMAAAQRAGGHVGIGDHATFHGLGLVWEIEALAAGMSTAEALRIATMGNAYLLGMEHEIGSLEPGKKADLLILAGDPLADIRHLRQIRQVMKDGVLRDAGTLEEVWPSSHPAPQTWWRDMGPPDPRDGARMSGGVPANEGEAR